MESCLAGGASLRRRPSQLELPRFGGHFLGLHGGVSIPISAPCGSADWSASTGASPPIRVRVKTSVLRVSRFVVCGAVVVEAGVPATDVVPAFDPAEAVLAGLVSSLEASSVSRIDQPMIPRLQRVHDQGHVQPALRGGDVGDVGIPDLVGTSGVLEERRSIRSGAERRSPRVVVDRRLRRLTPSRPSFPSVWRRGGG